MALAAVLVLIAVGIRVAVLIAVLSLIALLIGILILIVHDFFLQIILRKHRRPSMPQYSGFILSFENQAGQQTGQNSGSDASGGGFQSAGENAEEAILCNRFLHTFG